MDRQTLRDGPFVTQPSRPSERATRRATARKRRCREAPGPICAAGWRSAGPTTPGSPSHPRLSRGPTSAYSCGFMKRASATRAGCVTGGGAGASVPPGRVKSATSGPNFSAGSTRPDTGDDVTLVMPSVAKVMDLFLAHFADTLDQRPEGGPVGTTGALRTTSPWRCCRLRTQPRQARFLSARAKPHMDRPHAEPDRMPNPSSSPREEGFINCRSCRP